jgi:hypothetical protein
VGYREGEEEEEEEEGTTERGTFRWLVIFGSNIYVGWRSKIDTLLCSFAYLNCTTLKQDHASAHACKGLH